MLTIEELLSGGKENSAVGALAKAYGLEPTLAETAASAVLPHLAHRIERNTLSRGGIADLIALLGNPSFQKALDDPASLATADGEALGIQALEELLWRKDISRKVAAKVSAESGVDEDQIKKLLPGVAALTIGALAKRSEDDLTQIVQRISGSPLPLPDENPTDTGGVGHQVPLPVPGDNFGSRRGGGPFDDLSDIIRKGGRHIPRGRTGTGGVSGRDLGGLVRDILGNLLGFKNRGFVSWLINLVVMRILLPVIKRIISRVLFGR